MCTVCLIRVPKIWEDSHFIELCILIHDFTVQGLYEVTQDLEMIGTFLLTTYWDYISCVVFLGVAGKKVILQD